MASKIQGSLIKADPRIQRLDTETARDITKQVKNVYEIEQKSNDWKNKVVDTVVIVAAAAALLAVGVIAGAGTVIGGVAIGLAAGLVAYGIYSAITAGMKAAAKDQISEVHEEATESRLAKTIQEKQYKLEKKQAKKAKEAALQQQVAAQLNTKNTSRGATSLLSEIEE